MASLTSALLLLSLAGLSSGFFWPSSLPTGLPTGLPTFPSLPSLPPCPTGFTRWTWPTGTPPPWRTSTFPWSRRTFTWPPTRTNTWQTQTFPPFTTPTGRTFTWPPTRTGTFPPFTGTFPTFTTQTPPTWKTQTFTWPPTRTQTWPPTRTWTWTSPTWRTNTWPSQTWPPISTRTITFTFPPFTTWTAHSFTWPPTQTNTFPSVSYTPCIPWTKGPPTPPWSPPPTQTLAPCATNDPNCYCLNGGRLYSQCLGGHHYCVCYCRPGYTGRHCQYGPTTPAPWTTTKAPQQCSCTFGQPFCFNCHPTGCCTSDQEKVKALCGLAQPNGDDLLNQVCKAVDTPLS